MVDWKAVAEKLPTAQTPEEKEKRMEIFQAFDPNNNGYLSLAEVDKGCKDVLLLYEIFEAKKVIMRAFQTVKSSNDKKNKPGSHGPDYIERSEFRLLLVYLRQYFEMWQMFACIDQTNDHRISFEQFQEAIPKIAAWGLKVVNADDEFKTIDKNSGGYVLFDEFADWALAKRLDLEDDDDF